MQQKESGSKQNKIFHNVNKDGHKIYHSEDVRSPEEKEKALKCNDHKSG